MDFCNIRRSYRRWFYNLNGGFFVRTAVGFKNLFYKFVAFIHFRFTFRVPSSSSLSLSRLKDNNLDVFLKEKLSLLASNICPQEEACQLAFSLPWSSLIGHLVLLNTPCFPSKEMQAWPPLAVEGKFASQGNLKIRCAWSSAWFSCLRRSVGFIVIASSFIRRASEEEDGFQECDKE